MSTGNTEAHIEAMGLVVHVALICGHGLGIAHNLKKRNWWDVVAHTLAGGYDVWASSKHYNALTHLNKRG